MGVVDNIPLCLGNAVDRYSAHQACSAFPLCQMSDIDDIAENIRQSVAVPQKGAALLIVVGDDPVLEPIPARRWNIPFVEHPGDRSITEPLGAPLIDLPDHRSCFRINQKPVFVLRVLTITVRSITADILSILTFGLQCRAGFHGDVLRVIVVYDILDGNRQFIL